MKEKEEKNDFKKVRDVGLRGAERGLHSLFFHSVLQSGAKRKGGYGDRHFWAMFEGKREDFL